MRQFSTLKVDWFKFRKIILDIIFPIRCVGCQKEGRWICERCWVGLKLYNYSLCPICGLESKNGSVCGYCQKLTSLDGLSVILEKNNLSQKLIHFVKYNFVVDILTVLKPQFIEYFKINPWWRDFFVLVPVPLHRRRLLERGFNQSQLIAQIISEIKGNKINPKLLQKIKYNHHQVGLSADKRRSNIIDSFRVSFDLKEDYHQTIVIVDDVYTTGSTMEECARVLKEAGYQKVWGLVLIRG